MTYAISRRLMEGVMDDDDDDGLSDVEGGRGWMRVAVGLAWDGVI